jgi:hypothetical protein
MKFSREAMPLKMMTTPLLSSRSFNLSKMEDVQTSEVDVKLSPLNAHYEILYANRSSEAE